MTPYISTTPQTSRVFDSTATSQTITGLNNGTSYRFKVAAINAIGTGAQSGYSNTIVPFGVPFTPSNVSATGGNGQATVNWSTPSSNGSSITGYVVTPYIGTTAQTERLFNSTSTSQTVTSLTNGTAYTFRVAATNAAGTGSQSAASNSVTPAGVPGAPTGVSGTSGDSQVSLTWSAPANNGGSPVTGYVVTPYIGEPLSRRGPSTRRSPARSSPGSRTARATRSAVAAKNAVGTGNQSSASSQ